MTNSNQRQIHLALADESPLYRQLMCSYLKEFGVFEIDIQTDNGAELISSIKKATTKPDICIIDINLPVKNGYDTVKEIKATWPTIKVLVVTLFHSEYSIIQMLKNGANGYLLKNCYPDDLKKALLAIHNIGSYHTELTLNHINNAFNRSGNQGLKINDKEMQFLSYCWSDYHYKEIADKMGVSPRTVDGYREDLFDKLKIKTRTGLAMYAHSIGLIPFGQH